MALGQIIGQVVGVVSSRRFSLGHG
jgi:hypothetical protein